jgi:hypothetical protein
MTRHGQQQARNWVHFACLGATILAVLLVAIGAGFWHQDAPGSEATCAICHLAHLTPAVTSFSAGLSAPLVLAWHLPAEIYITQASPTALSAPPRAPPV